VDATTARRRESPRLFLTRHGCFQRAVPASNRREASLLLARQDDGIFVSRAPEEDSGACVENFLSIDADAHARPVLDSISSRETLLIMTVTKELFS
jgi:hypothetical protein